MIVQYNGTLTYFDKKACSLKLKIENCRKQDNIYAKLIEVL